MGKNWGKKWVPPTEPAKGTKTAPTKPATKEPTMAQLVATLDKHGIRVQPE